MATTRPPLKHALGVVRDSLFRLPQPAGAPICVAVSGGRDSVALAGLLSCVARRLHQRVVLLHVDHGLRAESASEAQRVRDLGRHLGASVIVHTLALTTGPGLAQRARDARHAALARLAVDVGAAHVALAHTATDQAETLLLHLGRGAGLEGAAAMSELESWRWRPLLWAERGDSRRFCDELGLGFVDDPTNTDLSAPRVRVRERVLPELQQAHPNAVRAMAEFCGRAAAARDALEEIAARELAGRALPRREDGTAWNVNGLHSLPEALRAVVVRQLLTAAGATVSELRSQVVDEIGRAVGRYEGKRWNLHPGLSVVLNANEILVLSAGAAGAGPETNH